MSDRSLGIPSIMSERQGKGSHRWPGMGHDASAEEGPKSRVGWGLRKPSQRG